MILVDTAVWIDHISRPLPALASLLRAGRVAMHPYVIGEIALGNLRDRSVLVTLSKLPMIPEAADCEVLSMIEGQGFAGSGIGYLDAHLLASVMRRGSDTLWSRDRRLKAVASRIGVAYEPPTA